MEPLTGDEVLTKLLEMSHEERECFAAYCDNNGEQHLIYEIKVEKRHEDPGTWVVELS